MTNIATRVALGALGLDPDALPSLVSVDGEDCRTYMLTGGALHIIDGKRDRVAEQSADDAGTVSQCQGRTVRVTSDATFELAVTTGRANGAPDTRVWTFNLGFGAEFIEVRAEAGSPEDAFGRALANAIRQASAAG